MKKVLAKTLYYKREFWTDDSWETTKDESVTILKTLPYRKDDIFDFFKTNSTGEMLITICFKSLNLLKKISKY